MTVSARHVHVSGRVQGVAFRWSTRTQADRLGVRGWVRNRADGRVETWIQGDPGAVDAMLDWLDHGPTMARVDEVAVQTVKPVELHEFEVRDTAR